MKYLFISLFSLIVYGHIFSQPYTPTPENLKAREWFSDARFGLFIHWGPFSIPGSGEWVMQVRNISVKN
ncbi:MAG TPA: alpha-L-fucosidase, partial [Chitinophagaceae bacterium]|nr:alpha-L-fucosidase [Chitinophagaceae bacterium]